MQRKSSSSIEKDKEENAILREVVYKARERGIEAGVERRETGVREKCAGENES